MIRLSFQGLARFADYGVCRSGIGAITPPRSLEVEVETPQARLPGGGGLATGVLRRISLAAALLLPGSVHGGLISLSTAPLDAAGSNLAAKYYLGLDPEVRDSSEFISRLEHDGKAWLRYRIPLDPRVDASALGLWYSFDLSAWLPAADDLAGTVIESRDADEWSLEVSSSDHPDAFFLLRSGPQPP